MIEHRLIEKMVARIVQEGKRIEGGGHVDHDFLLDAVDFMRNYADRCHHGKEEDILFLDLRKKHMSMELEASLDQLIKDHIRARDLVRSIEEGSSKMVLGDASAKEQIVNAIAEMGALYPRHIEEEDKRFFIRAMELFSREEKDAMIAEFHEFDRMLIHERYRRVYERWTSKM